MPAFEKSDLIHQMENILEEDKYLTRERKREIITHLENMTESSIQHMQEVYLADGYIDPNEIKQMVDTINKEITKDSQPEPVRKSPQARLFESPAKTSKNKSIEQEHQVAFYQRFKIFNQMQPRNKRFTPMEENMLRLAVLASGTKGLDVIKNQDLNVYLANIKNLFSQDKTLAQTFLSNVEQDQKNNMFKIGETAQEITNRVIFGMGNYSGLTNLNCMPVVKMHGELAELGGEIPNSSIDLKDSFEQQEEIEEISEAFELATEMQDASQSAKQMLGEKKGWSKNKEKQADVEASETYEEAHEKTQGSQSNINQPGS